MKSSQPEPAVSKLARIAFGVVLLCWGLPSPGFAESLGTNLWKVRLPGLFADASPAVAPDGTIYQATFDGTLFAVTPQGAVKWKFKAGREIKSSPAVADDGTIYFGSRDRKFYAVTPEGRLKWTFPTGAWVDSSPAIGADGTVYLGSWDNFFYALNPDGSKKWEFASRGIIDSSPAIAADGTIYFGSHDKKLYALKPDGTVRWTFLSGGEIISSPAIAADGTIYFTSTDGNLYALHPDGTERWRFSTGGVTEGVTESSPVLDETGNIYLAVGPCIVSVGPDGKKRWNWCSSVSINAAPAVAASGGIYCSAPWRRLFAFRQDRAELWHVDTELNLSASPVIGDNGNIYACDGKWLYAIVPPGNPAPPAKSSWPMFRADARHTGRVRNSR
jgi:outer membrane protein assembly factor BamB